MARAIFSGRHLRIVNPLNSQHEFLKINQKGDFHYV